MQTVDASGVIGQKNLLTALTHASQMPAPGYLFFGPAGIGKRVVAERFTRALLDHASSLLLTAHPDFLRLAREEGARDIVVKQAREVLERIHLSSANGGRRVILVEEADRLNEEAANALLKAVEEPPRGVTFIFIAEQPERLPATLRSRLVLIPFERVSKNELTQALLARGVDQKKAETIASRSYGCPGIALRLVEDPGLWDESFRAANETLQALEASALGAQLAAIERSAHAAESEEDTERAWRSHLTAIMHAMPDRFRSDPATASRVGHGLIHAWRLVGTSLSPRLGLEWAAVQPWLSANQSIPSFLQQPYL